MLRHKRVWFFCCWALGGGGGGGRWRGKGFDKREREERKERERCKGEREKKRPRSLLLSSSAARLRSLYSRGGDQQLREEQPDGERRSGSERACLV